jgi:hypothetical protein
MSSTSKHKSDLMKLMLSDLEETSSDAAKAREFLASEGVNVDRMVSEGLKQIKKMRFQLEANKTRQTMIAFDKYAEKAKTLAFQLLHTPTFSFLDYLKNENVVANFSNLQQLTDDEKLSIIQNHIALKLQQEADNQ